MSKGMRYNMEHLGDIVVDGIEKCFQGINRSFRGISLTYNIHELNRKKRKQYTKLGKSLTQVRRKKPHLDVFQEDEITDLYQAMDALEEELEGAMEERERRLYPENFETAGQEV